MTARTVSKNSPATTTVPDPPAPGAPLIVTKAQFARVVQMSTRTIASWMAAGMPHLKPGPRKSLIETQNALAWLRERYQVHGRPSGYRPRMKQRTTAQTKLANKKGSQV